MSGKVQPLPALKLPPIESTRPYQELLKLREDANKALDAYGKKLTELTETVQTWNRSDDVSKLYAEVFPPDRIIDHPMERPKLLEDLKWRTIHHVPPAFQDDAKPDGGIGDLHIWHSIIYAGQTLKNDIIFISNDEKNDWMVRVNKAGLFARSELVDEYYVATKRHFAVMTLDDFLKLQGASAETAEEVKPQQMVTLSFKGPEVLVIMRREVRNIRRFLQIFLSQNLPRIEPTKLKRHKKSLGILLVRCQPHMTEKSFSDHAIMLGLLENIDKLNAQIVTPDSTPEIEKIRGRLRHFAERFILMSDSVILGVPRLTP